MAKKSSLNTDLSAMVADINKTLGEGTVMSFSDENKLVPVIGSGSISLDQALGGGYPLGRIIEVYGMESSGKTTLTLEAIVKVQKAGKAAMFLDMENAFDPSYAEALGIDLSPDAFLLSQPESGEDAFTILEKGVSHEQIGIIVVDSVACMTPRAEMEGEFGESKVGLQARMMSQGMRKLVGAIKKSNTIVIFINQLREKIGVMFGNPETTTGGKALQFYASQRIRVSKKQGNKDKEGELQTNEVTFKVVKNKIAPPMREAKLHIRFGEGFDRYTEILEYAVALDIVEKAGAYFKFNDKSIGQGVEVARARLIEDAELFQIIEDAVIDSIYS